MHADGLAVQFGWLISLRADNLQRGLSQCFRAGNYFRVGDRAVLAHCCVDHYVAPITASCGDLGIDGRFGLQQLGLLENAWRCERSGRLHGRSSWTGVWLSHRWEERAESSARRVRRIGGYIGRGDRRIVCMRNRRGNFFRRQNCWAMRIYDRGSCRLFRDQRIGWRGTRRCAGLLSGHGILRCSRII